MVDFKALSRKNDEDRKRGYREEKQTLMRCPDCKIEAVFQGYVEAVHCTEPHRPRVMMRIIKCGIEKVPV